MDRDPLLTYGYFLTVLTALLLALAMTYCYRADVASVEACLTVGDDSRRSACIIGASP